MNGYEKGVLWIIYRFGTWGVPWQDCGVSPPYDVSGIPTLARGTLMFEIVCQSGESATEWGASDNIWPHSVSKGMPTWADHGG